MSQEILSSYRRLSDLLLQERDRRLPVAVRSSATAEDLPEASFAGQQETYLNVLGDEDLLEKVKDCWASLWTARAISYREKQRFDHQEIDLAVVVQAMIPSQVSGVLFTANPISGDLNEAVLNASWGLGEAIVSGMVTPDSFVVRKGDGEILSRQIGEKEITIRSLPDGGIEKIETQEAQRKVAALTDTQIKALVELGTRIEDLYGTPQDIEWALANNRFYALQTRPITTLVDVEPAVATDDEYNRTMFVEIFPDALSPIFLSVMRPLLKQMLDFTLKAWGFDPPIDREAVGVFNHQPYFNKTYLEEALESLSKPVRDRLVAQLINPFGRHEQVMRGELSPAFLGLIARMMRFMVRFPSQLPEIVAQYQQEVGQVEAQVSKIEMYSDDEIVDSVNTLVFEYASNFLSYDFLMIALIGITYQVLGTLLERSFGQDTELMRAKLISGVTGNVTMEANIRLWDLAQIAKSDPEVYACIREEEDTKLIERLEESVGGREFLRALDAFLSEFGHREIRLDILYPTWGEDPTPVFGFIRGYLEAEESQNPHRQQARLVEERQTTTEEVLAHLESKRFGRSVIAPLFRWILEQAQVHTRERDTMHFELTRLFPPFRRMLIELGKRWAGRGDFHNADDIFYLHLEELVALSSKPSSMHDVVAERREEFEESKAGPWPDVISSEGEKFLAPLG
ncbi:MAG: hypothetical protein GTO14_11205, partial [Anaerolineales bacterium]|nr:hypothetical protein [Anaerolineales bacterium]